jgi:hypothetical protein
MNYVKWAVAPNISQKFPVGGYIASSDLSRHENRLCAKPRMFAAQDGQAFLKAQVAAERRIDQVNLVTSPE